MHRSLLLTSCALLAAFVGGCGSLASDTDQHEPLAVLQGELTNPDAVATSNAVRVAVVWNCGELDGEMYRTSQEVEVQPVFPSRFRLALTEPPPAGCMIDPFADGDDDPPSDTGDTPGSGGNEGEEGTTPATPPPPNMPQNLSGSGEFRVALGTIAAYDDLNANGKLDLVGPDAEQYVDAILGTNESLMLVYFEGSVPQTWDDLRDGEGNLPSLGYNLLQTSDSIATATETDVLTYSCGYSSGSEEPVGGTEEPVPMPERDEESYEGPTMQWLDASTFFVLTMTADPRFATMMCRDAGGLSSEASGSAPVVPGSTVEIPPEYPAADDPGLTCMPDGLSYYHETCVRDGVCSGKICTGECWYVPDASNPPADWPCPIE